MITGPPIVAPKSLAISLGLLNSPKFTAFIAAFCEYQKRAPWNSFVPLFETVVTSPIWPYSAGLPTPCTLISAMDSVDGNALVSGELPVTSVIEIPSSEYCVCD